MAGIGNITKIEEEVVGEDLPSADLGDVPKVSKGSRATSGGIDAQEQAVREKKIEATLRGVSDINKWVSTTLTAINKADKDSRDDVLDIISDLSSVKDLSGRITKRGEVVDKKEVENFYKIVDRLDRKLERSDRVSFGEETLQDYLKGYEKSTRKKTLATKDISDRLDKVSREIGGNFKDFLSSNIEAISFQGIEETFVDVLSTSLLGPLAPIVGNFVDLGRVYDGFKSFSKKGIVSLSNKLFKKSEAADDERASKEEDAFDGKIVKLGDKIEGTLKEGEESVGRDDLLDAVVEASDKADSEGVVEGIKKVGDTLKEDQGMEEKDRRLTKKFRRRNLEYLDDIEDNSGGGGGLFGILGSTGFAAAFGASLGSSPKLLKTLGILGKGLGVAAAGAGGYAAGTLLHNYIDKNFPEITKVVGASVHGIVETTEFRIKKLSHLFSSQVDLLKGIKNLDADKIGDSLLNLHPLSLALGESFRDNTQLTDAIGGTIHSAGLLIGENFDKVSESISGVVSAAELGFNKIGEFGSEALDKLTEKIESLPFIGKFFKGDKVESEKDEQDESLKKGDLEDLAEAITSDQTPGVVRIFSRDKSKDSADTESNLPRSSGRAVNRKTGANLVSVVENQKQIVIPRSESPTPKHREDPKVVVGKPEKGLVTNQYPDPLRENLFVDDNGLTALNLGVV